MLYTFGEVLPMQGAKHDPAHGAPVEDLCGEPEAGAALQPLQALANLGRQLIVLHRDAARQRCRQHVLVLALGPNTLLVFATSYEDSSGKRGYSMRVDDVAGHVYEAGPYPAREQHDFLSVAQAQPQRHRGIGW